MPRPRRLTPDRLRPRCKRGTRNDEDERQPWTRSDVLALANVIVALLGLGVATASLAVALVALLRQVSGM